MKRSLALLLLLVSGLFAFDPQGGNIGLGFFLGGGVTHSGNAGLHAQYWFNHHQSVNAAASWGWGHGWGGVNLQADYIFNHWYDLLVPAKQDIGKFPLYVGLGGWVGLWNNRYWVSDRAIHRTETELGAGVRVPFGVDFLVKEGPFDVFAEITPGMQIVPSTDFTLDLIIGGHYCF